MRFPLRRLLARGWGWHVNTGLWFTRQRLDCSGRCAETAMILPEVRIAAIRAR